MPFLSVQSKEFQQAYWECVRRLLESIYKTDAAGDRLAFYRGKVLGWPGADQTLIYHTDPLSLAARLAEDSSIRVDLDQVSGIMRQLGLD